MSAHARLVIPDATEMARIEVVAGEIFPREVVNVRIQDAPSLIRSIQTAYDRWWRLYQGEQGTVGCADAEAG